MGSFPWDKCFTSPNNQKGKCVYPWESTLTMYHHVPTRYIYIWPNYSATWKNILPFKQNPSLSYKDSAFLPVFFGPGTATQIEDTRHTTSSWLFKPHPKICSSKWESSPNRGENRNYFELPPPRLVPSDLCVV